MWLYWVSAGLKFNQIKCKEYGLNTDDLYYLSYLNQLFHSGKASFTIKDDVNWALITFRKLEEDCTLVYWKAKTFKNKLKHYQFLGLVDIYRPNPRTPKTYFRLHLDNLCDDVDNMQWKECSGLDDTLAWYSGIQKINKFRNIIKYRFQTFKYFSTGIIPSVIQKYNKSDKRAYPNSLNSYKEVYKSALKRLVSKEVYEKYFERFNMFIEPDGNIHLEFYSPGVGDAILCINRYHIERALCDAFLYVCRDADAREKLSSFDSNLY